MKGLLNVLSVAVPSIGVVAVLEAYPSGSPEGPKAAYCSESPDDQLSHDGSHGDIRFSIERGRDGRDFKLHHGCLRLDVEVAFVEPQSTSLSTSGEQSDWYGVFIDWQITWEVESPAWCIDHDDPRVALSGTESVLSLHPRASLQICKTDIEGLSRLPADEFVMLVRLTVVRGGSPFGEEALPQRDVVIGQRITRSIIESLLQAENVGSVDPSPWPVDTVDLGSGVSMRLCGISPGRFVMGSPGSEQNRDSDEVEHGVQIGGGLWIGQTEVTQAQWKVVMGSSPSRFGGNPSRPVEGVSWDEAQEFCRRLSLMTGMDYRLPTEAEWEYSCRAGSKAASSFGDDETMLDSHAWFERNSGGHTHPVATRRPNDWGLYDMHGNVSEWCADWYGPYDTDGSDRPLEPRNGGTKVVRGGSWVDRARISRSAYRSNRDPGSRSNYVGFRVVREDPRAMRVEAGLSELESATEKTPKSIGRTRDAPVEVAAAEAVQSVAVLDLGSGESIRFVKINPGRFVMGSRLSEPHRYNDESLHQVSISREFWIGQTEVTQAQWQAVMGSCPSCLIGYPSHPVEKVSWEDATEFCRTLSRATGMTFRLPTEAEWEYSCRAGAATAYSFGDDASGLGETAWFDQNSGGGSRPVASRKPNRWGLFDMHGNVWEWCSDTYGEYPVGPTTDPQGRATSGARDGAVRVLRGGSWSSQGAFCRAALRLPEDREQRSANIGFRLVWVR